MSDTEEEKTIAEDTVITKYNICGDVVKKVAKNILAKCVPGASVMELCKEGDEMLEKEIRLVYRKEKGIKKGIAFPVCICVNNCINHFSPNSSDDDITLTKGDLVKLDLAAHIDGLIATMAHTIVVGISGEEKVSGRKADAILAAHYAMNAAINMLKHNNTNYQVTDAVLKVAECFQCKPIEGMLSFQLQQNRIEGEKTIIQNPSELQRKEIAKQPFEINEVYALDVIVSTGSGKGRELETKVTIYKKTDEQYSLKLKTSREFYAKVSKQFDAMPFNMRHFDDEKKARMGLTECVNHKLIESYPVLYEKPNEIVAQFKNTILLKSNPINVTEMEFDTSTYESEYKIEDPDLQALVVREKKKKKKSSKKPQDKTDGNKENKSEDKGKEDKSATKEKKSDKLKDKNTKTAEVKSEGKEADVSEKKTEEPSKKKSEKTDAKKDTKKKKSDSTSDKTDNKKQGKKETAQ